MQMARDTGARTAKRGKPAGESRGWGRLISAHQRAQKRFGECAIRAAETLKRRHQIERRKPGQTRLSAQLDHADLLAAAEREELEAEADADRAHDEMMRLERLALSRPATTPTALRFKLSLLADGGLEGREAEWRIFLADCARLGGQAGW